MKKLHVCTNDLGGGGGKMFVGSFDGSRISLEEVHRYAFGMTRVGDDFYWDFPLAVDNVMRGLGKAAHLYDGKLISFAAAGFGNSLVMLDKNGKFFTPSYCDYSGRMGGVCEDFFQKHIGPYELHKRTGTDVRSYQSIMLLHAYKLNQEEWILDQTAHIMQHVDALKFFLTGERCTERTAASISGLCAASTRDWDTELVEMAGIKLQQLPPIVDPCTRMAQVTPRIAEAVGLKQLLVCNAAQHDTASASLAIPSPHKNSAFFSIGTYALCGMEIDEIITNQKTMDYAIGNEANPFRRNRFLCSCRAMWYLEKCRDYMRRKGRECSYQDLIYMAEQESPMRFFIDLNNFAYFTAADDIPQRIVTYCQETRQGKIERFSQVIRCIFDSIAWTASMCFRQLTEVSGIPVDHVYAIGGGARNELLCQTMANILQKSVSAGPFEASTMGVVAAQLAAMGELHGPEQIRSVIASSVNPIRFDPQCVYDLKWAQSFEENKLQHME